MHVSPGIRSTISKFYERFDGHNKKGCVLLSLLFPLQSRDAGPAGKEVGVKLLETIILIDFRF